MHYFATSTQEKSAESMKITTISYKTSRNDAHLNQESPENKSTFLLNFLPIPLDGRFVNFSGLFDWLITTKKKQNDFELTPVQSGSKSLNPVFE